MDARLISNNEQISKLSTQVAELNRENRQLKKTIYAYQLWSQTPGVIGNAQQQPPVASYHVQLIIPEIASINLEVPILFKSF